jgi:TolA-binding protein
MTNLHKALATLVLTMAVATVSAQTTASTTSTTKKAHHHRAAAAVEHRPSVESQIQDLRTQMDSQKGEIDTLKQQLSDRDAQLQQAQQAAAAAQAAAQQAQQAANQEQQQITESATAVTSLQTSVSDLKASDSALATSVQTSTTEIKKAIEHPSVLRYKGVDLTPGGFAAGETIYRTKATGGDIPTAFSSIPYEGADAYSLGEFYGSARQSRMALMAEGKTDWGTLRGYWEADWLGTGITSNNNQSNSYVFRQRVLWAQAQTNSGWAFTGGQLWSLATEDKKGISNLSGDIMTPQTIDPNYVAGFVWTRQYGFRITKTWDKVAIGVSAENPQLLYTATLAGNTPYAVLGSAGQNGGNYNAAISASATTTYVQNYTNEPGTTSYIPVYATVVANTNIANLSFNAAPDFLVKLALDPGWGHWEFFGIARTAHETVYPGVTTDITKYGTSSGIYDIYCPKGQTSPTTGLACAPIEPAASSKGSYSNTIWLGGFGASVRAPIAPQNKLVVGAKALYGAGMGRYGDTTLSDVTSDPQGMFSPLHNLSGLLTVEANPTNRLAIYLNYGGDYVDRDDFANAKSTTLGSPTAYFCPEGYTAATASSVCTKSPSASVIAGGGTWGGHWGAPSEAAMGYGSKMTSNSSCETISNPGYSGSSTGYYPGGSCGAQTRDVQEITGGYWYDFYKGEHGRFRQGIQYGYAVREGWSGLSGIGTKGIDNMVWTSLRYYLP